MRIKSINIKNLRSIQEETINLDNYTCLVGANGAGKSTILCALNIFFREKDNSSTDLSILSEEDFHNRDISKPIEISIVFHKLSDEIKQDFKDYYREKEDELTISAIAEFKENKAEVKQYGYRLGIEEFNKFFEKYADNKIKVEDLKNIYEKLRAEYQGLPEPSSKDKMNIALREYETTHTEKCASICREAHFYGNKSELLEKYIQWVYIPAVKDVTQEQSNSKKSSALYKLLERVVHIKSNVQQEIEELRKATQEQYQTILNDNQSALGSISSILKERIVEWAHPKASIELKWQQEPNKSVIIGEPLIKVLAGEENFEGEIARFGHGFQRSYLLALLQELAMDGEEGGTAPLLILGCEEPELFQHPSQARHLKQVFENLSQRNTQIIISTHSPFFVTGDNFENIRMVKRDANSKSSVVKQVTLTKIAARYKEVTEEELKEEAILAKIHQILQPTLSEMFFTKQLALVEGYEDIAYIHTWLLLNDQWNNFRASGYYLVPTSGKNGMIKAIIIAQELNIPLFVIFDADSEDNNENHKKHHKEENTAILKLINYDDCSNPFPEKTVWGNDFVMWKTKIGDVIKSEFKASIGEEVFTQINDEANASLGQAGNLHKNTLLIGEYLKLAKDKGAQSDSLSKLCEKLITNVTLTRTD